jgi:hypothetical protein
MPLNDVLFKLRLADRIRAMKGRLAAPTKEAAWRALSRDVPQFIADLLREPFALATKTRRPAGPFSSAARASAGDGPPTEIRVASAGREGCRGRAAPVI